MFSLPIDDVTLPFAAPLGGAGRLHLQVGDDVLLRLKNNLPFTGDVAHGPDKLLVVTFDLGMGTPLRLGPLRDVAFEVSTGTQAALDIVWPDEDPSPLAPYGLTLDGDAMYLVLACTGQAAVHAEAEQHFAPYALSATLGLQTGAAMGLRYLKRFDRHTGAADVLRRFFAGVRLPFNIATAEAVPEPGEVVSFQYSGYLDVRMQAAWGYTLNRYTAPELGRLSLQQHLEVTSALQLDVGFKLAGAFSMEVQRGHRSGWARVVVRRQRQRAWSGAADLAVGVTLATEGLPADAGRFVEALLELDLPAQVRALRPLLDLQGDALDAWLREEADGLTEHLVRSLFERWYPDATIAAKAGPFLKKLQQALDAYEDARSLDERLLGLLEGSSRDALEAVREKLAALATRGGAAGLHDVLTLNVLRQLLGERFFDFLTDDEAFATLKAEVEEKLGTLLEAEKAPLIDLSDVCRTLLQVDALAAELRRYDTPGELKEQAERHLLALAQRLTGKAFDALKGSKLREAFEELRTVLNHLDVLKTRLYDRFAAALNDAHRMELSLRYTAATEHDALLDVEIDLNEPEGQRLMRQALHGDFSSVLTPVAAAHVVVHEGRFTHLTRKTRSLSITLLGWEYSHFHELALHTEELVQPQGDGLLHVYSLKATERDERRRRGEAVQLSFMLGLLAEGFEAPDTRPDLVDTVSQMTAEYALQIDDVETTDREMRDYLALARHLKLLPADLPTDDYLASLRQQLGLAAFDPWGTVTLAYRVRYDPMVLLQIFRFLKPPSIRAITRDTFRRIVAANFARFGNPNTTALARAIGCDGMHQAWRQGKLRLQSASSEAFTVPCGDGGAVSVVMDQLRRLVLDALYQTEDAFTDALVDLDDVLDRVADDAKPDRKRLQKAFEAFAGQRRALEQFMTLDQRDRFVSPFFAILDAHIATLQQAGLVAPHARRSTLEFTITQGDRKLSKILTA